MKKLLSILSVLCLTTPSLSVMACVKKDKEEKLTELQAEMVSGAEFVSRLIIAARHENLNFNINDLLSSIFTPESAVMRFPRSYNFQNEAINIAKPLNLYTSYLAPSFPTLDQNYNATAQASYIMGMYNDEFYQPIINGSRGFEDTLSKSGGVGYNKNDGNDGTGYFAGLNKDLQLAESQERRDLAWGIQDTGPLTNYLLNQGFDGGIPGDTRTKTKGGGSGPGKYNAGSNGGGYASYASLMYGGDAHHNINDMSMTVNQKFEKLGLDMSLTAGKNNYSATRPFDESSILNVGSEQIAFNQIGGKMMQAAEDNNVYAGVSFFDGLMQNVSSSSSGALFTAELGNYLLPVLPSKIKSDAFIQAIGNSLITNIWNGINNLGKKASSVAKYFDPALMSDIQSLVDGPNPMGGLPPSDNNVKHEQLGLDVLYKFNGYENGTSLLNDDGSNVRKIIRIIDGLIAAFNSKDAQTQRDMIVEIFEVGGHLSFGYSLITMFTGAESWNNVVSRDNGQGAMRLLEYIKGVYEMALDENILNAISQIQNEMGDAQNFRNLSASQKQRYLALLGYGAGGFATDSYLDKFYKGITSSEVTGRDDFLVIFTAMKNSISNGMWNVHGTVYQNIFSDKFWSRKNTKINTTSNTSLTGEMEFTLNYTGMGDGSSTASQQTKKVIVPEDFNPYQVKFENQSAEFLGADNTPGAEALSKIDTQRAVKSGRVLGVEQEIISENDLISYDGLGLLKDLKKVNFEYKVKWKNVSFDPNNPYWVISGIECYNNGVRFYNIY